MRKRQEKADKTDVISILSAYKSIISSFVQENFYFSMPSNSTSNTKAENGLMCAPLERVP